MLLAAAAAVVASTIGRFLLLPGPGPALQAAYPVMVGVGVLILPGLVVGRHRLVALLTAPAVLYGLAMGVGSLRDRTVPAGRDDLVVMSLNMFHGKADAAAIVAEVGRIRPHVLVLVETDTGAVARLRAAGLDQMLPNQVGRTAAGEWEAGTTLIRARIPLSEVPPTDTQVSPADPADPVARVRHAGGELLLRGSHPQSPGLLLSGSWRRELAALGEWISEQPTDVPLIVAGDLNSSSVHRAFRDATRGLQDAHDATGAGWVRTWPLGLPVPPFVHLDHVLVRGFGVVDAGLFVVSGTDHAGVWARLSPASPGVASPRSSGG
ncbi:MAG TPA: endonuclease/exonuclease/phosphatase family protein [Dermatophilaceae bacterium]|nr:endonuclease/exonuclease/phosphatase family protein [Dermatophilaceae bacterium]